MYAGNEKAVVSIRGVKNGYVLSHSYTVEQKHGKEEKYYANDEYIFATKEETIALAADLI